MFIAYFLCFLLYHFVSVFSMPPYFLQSVVRQKGTDELFPSMPFIYDMLYFDHIVNYLRNPLRNNDKSSIRFGAVAGRKRQKFIPETCRHSGII